MSMRGDLTSWGCLPESDRLSLAGFRDKMDRRGNTHRAQMVYKRLGTLSSLDGGVPWPTRAN